MTVSIIKKKNSASIAFKVVPYSLCVYHRLAGKRALSHVFSHLETILKIIPVLFFFNVAN